MSNLPQVLPRSGVAREQLREKGQFWTPSWVAEAMVAYTISDGSRQVFDPAVGEGAFLRATRRLGEEIGVPIAFKGTEIDAEALNKARVTGISDAELSGVQVRDFILNPPHGLLASIVANPPYIRHHRLSAEIKTHLRGLGVAAMGKSLDGRAGLHIYFLMQALQRLSRDGRLAFIVPADTCEGVFALPLWKWITRKYCVDAVVTFDAAATPFPGVDTNPLILFLRNSKPHSRFLWGRVAEPETTVLKEWVLSNFKSSTGNALSVQERDLAEGLATGFSRPQQIAQIGEGVTLSHFARVMRGVATGANEFFFLTPSQARALDLSDEFLKLAIGRTADVNGSEITAEDVKRLDDAGRPTRLLSLDGRPMEAFNPAMQNYLRRGENMGLPDRALIKMRKVWYKMESRRVPPFLFAYLGRRSARFIRNTAGIIPLTSFLCVYPIDDSQASIEKLWLLLQHPEVLKGLPLVGKSYGAGAIKVEPRSLERLPIERQVLREVGLTTANLLDHMEG